MLTPAFAVHKISPEKPAQCGACNQIVSPEPGWTCPNCKSKMWYGYLYAPCPHCHKTVMWMRKGNRLDVRCRCQETPEERRERLEFERIEEAKFRKERAKQEEAKAREVAAAKKDELTASATRCWHEEKKNSCQVTRAELKSPPRAYCHNCPKWTKK